MAAEQGVTVEPRLPKVSWETFWGQACSNEERTPTAYEREAGKRNREQWGRKTGVRRVGGAELDLSALPGLFLHS